MLHATDGLDKLEAGVSWSRVDDLRRIAESDKVEEVEPSREEFRVKPKPSSAYRWNRKDIE